MKFWRQLVTETAFDYNRDIILHQIMKCKEIPWHDFFFVKG